MKLETSLCIFEVYSVYSDIAVTVHLFANVTPISHLYCTVTVSLISFMWLYLWLCKMPFPRLRPTYCSWEAIANKNTHKTVLANDGT